MKTKQTATKAPTRPPVRPPINLCECAGCQFHIRRLETLNRQLATRNDELESEIARLRREGQRAA
jgi:hypothetical protein